MEKEITVKQIKDKTEFNSLGRLDRTFVDREGKEKTACFRASHTFLSVSSVDRVNDLIKIAVNELISKFEINNMYFFEIDMSAFFQQLEEKPNWINV